jgi:hypothetical protein
MSGTSVDLSRVSGLIDLGTHTFQITERSKEEMGPSGEPYWQIICRVISPGENQGRELMHSVSLGSKSRWKMDEFLDGIGAPRRGKWTIDQCVGKKFRATIGQDTYNGKLKSIIEAFIAPVEGEQLSMDSELSAPLDQALPEDVLGETGQPTEASGRRRF